MATNRVVIGLASNHAQAETIVNDLRANGFWNNNISVLFPNAKITRDFALEQNTKAPEGALAGWAPAASSVVLWASWLASER